MLILQYADLGFLDGVASEACESHSFMRHHLRWGDPWRANQISASRAPIKTITVLQPILPWRDLNLLCTSPVHPALRHGRVLLNFVQVRSMFTSTLL